MSIKDSTPKRRLFTSLVEDARLAKFKAEAAFHGVEFLGRGAGRNHKYKLTCGHEQDVRSDAMRDGQFSCRVCSIKKDSTSASLLGAEMLSKSRRKDYAVYKLKCGHTQEIAKCHMRRNNFECKTCLGIKLQTEAGKQGALIIGPGERKDRRMYRLACGHERTVAMNAMRKGWVRCNVCEVSWATKESNLYVHAVELGGEVVIKVGIARIIETRNTQYGLPADAQLTTLLTIPFSTGKDAIRAESRVKQTFKHGRKTNAKHIFTKSGWTECYEPQYLVAILTYCKSLALRSKAL
jgi:hypothetical protein